MANNCPNCSQGEFMTQEFFESGSPFGFESFEEEFLPHESFEGYEFGSELGQEVQAKTRAGQAAVQRHRNIHATMMKTIKAMAQHIKPSNGLLRIRIPARNLTEAASRLGVHPRLVANLLSSLRRRNERVQLGRTRVGELGELGEMSESELETPTCRGSTTSVRKWWGIEVWLNECHTKALIATLGAGAVGGTTCAAISPPPTPPGIACAVVAGAAGISAGALTAVDAMGGDRGIIVYSPYVGPPW